MNSYLGTIWAMITGCMNAFQSPASTVAVGLLVPKEKYIRVSGLYSFSSSLITVITPMLAAFISSFWGLGGVLFIDMVTFIFSFCMLLFIHIPEKHSGDFKFRKNSALNKENLKEL